jgi:hypothetical protein
MRNGEFIEFGSWNGECGMKKERLKAQDARLKAKGVGGLRFAVEF